MENDRDVPYTVHESIVARLERINKRFFALIILLIVLLFTTNGIWIWYESQFEDITITAEQTADGDSNNYAIGGDFYGSDAESHDQEANP